jgi:hypothetical protein
MMAGASEYDNPSPRQIGHGDGSAEKRQIVSGQRERFCSR